MLIFKLEQQFKVIIGCFTHIKIICYYLVEGHFPCQCFQHFSLKLYSYYCKPTSILLLQFTSTNLKVTCPFSGSSKNNNLMPLFNIEKKLSIVKKTRLIAFSTQTTNRLSFFFLFCRKAYCDKRYGHVFQ